MTQDVPGVPFFLSSMLSGLLALDVYSRKRLARDVSATLASLRATDRSE